MIISLEWVFTIGLFTLVMAKMFFKFTRHNVLYFEDVDSLTWSQDDYVITHGQPFVNATSKGAAIDVVAGLLKGPESSKQFRSGLQGANMLPTTTALGAVSRGVPHLLDFAIFGTVMFNIKGKQFKCKNMRFGQGGYPFVNNWWIGGPECHRDKRKTQLSCGHPSSCGLTFQAIPRSHGDHFKVRVMTRDDVESIDSLSPLRTTGGNYSLAGIADFENFQDDIATSMPWIAIVAIGILIGSLFVHRKFECSAQKGSDYSELPGSEAIREKV